MGLLTRNSRRLVAGVHGPGGGRLLDRQGLYVLVRSEVRKMLTDSPWSRHPLLDAPSPSRQLRARELESGGAGSENRDELKHLSVPPQAADDRDGVGA